MESRCISKKTKELLWPDFAAHFKSAASRASYWSDLCEFTRLTGKDITEAGAADVQRYYGIMTEKTKRGELQPGTPAKKFRELHSFADFLCRERERYGLPDTFQDYFYPYLPRLARQEKYARVIPVEDVDKLLKSAEEDRMAYTILVLMYRAGLSSITTRNILLDIIPKINNLFSGREKHLQRLFHPDLHKAPGRS